jgi:hypothetical protein
MQDISYVSYAYRVVVDAGPPGFFVTFGADIADAAARAHAAAGLPRGTAAPRIVSIELIGEALLPPGPAPSATPRAAPLPRSAPTPLPALPGTRVEQLCDLLRARGGSADLDAVCEALSVHRENAQNVVRAGIAAGLVARIGRRTGRFRLIEEARARRAPPERPTLAPPVPSPPTPAAVPRAPLVLTKRPRAGAAGPRPALPPEGVTGIRLRVWRALRHLGAAQTAAEVAGVLGCRPREAGNALTLLVDQGHVHADRTVGPARYRFPDVPG